MHYQDLHPIVLDRLHSLEARAQRLASAAAQAERDQAPGAYGKRLDANLAMHVLSSVKIWLTRSSSPMAKSCC